MMNLRDKLNSKLHSKKGFTLVELMTVVAILAITSGAMLTVFIMVHSVARDASEVTVNQYQTTQMERYIRNELQTANSIDFLGLSEVMDEDYGAEPGDEFLMYDSTRKSVVFMRADDDGIFQALLTIDDVSEATINISPLNAAEPSGNPYKLFYKITTSHYDYTGGMLLGNTCGDKAKDHSMTVTPSMGVHWGIGSDDDQIVLAYLREETKMAP